MVVQDKVSEETVKWIWERPLTFDQFVEMFGKEDHVELIDGVVVQREMVQLDHEKLQIWLTTAVNQFLEARDLGILLGSRTAVRITQFRGRLPDLIFIRRERMEIVQQKGVFGPPDLVIEIVTQGDRPSHAVSLETDYQTVGVAEIIFIDQRRRRVRVLRKREDGYAEEKVASGRVTLETLGGIWLETEWLFTEPRPATRAVVDEWLQVPPAGPTPEAEV
jgi:Uma2 family endonuclease